jgi:tripartite-type tricarboxylate transporter receptor subunit TctC
MRSIYLGLAVALGVGLSGAVSAQEFPSKRMTVVIPFTTGGSNDTIGRYVADGLSKLWKQPVVVENRPGAGSAIGAAHVANSPKDGHTLLFVSSTFTTNAATQKNLPFDPVKDLQPVAMGALTQMLVVAGNRIPSKSLKELMEAAKTQKVFYGSTGVGSSTQFAAELLNDVAGVKTDPVHYKGGTDAIVDMVGGRIDLYVGTVTQVQSNVKNNQVKAFAVMSSKRSEALPDVPTIAEAGYPGAEMDNWWGIFVAAGTPAPIVEKLNAGIREVMSKPEAAEFLSKQGALPSLMTQPEFEAHVKKELGKWKELATKHNIQPE